MRQPSVSLTASVMRSAVEAYQAGRFEGAKQLCLRILAVDVYHADALHLLGLIAHRSGGNDVAVKMIRRAIAAGNANAVYYSNLGLVLQDSGKLDESVAAYKDALEIRPDFLDAWTNLGHVFYLLGRSEESRACFERALAIDPDCRQAHNNLGIISLEQGNAQQARISFERAVSLDPNDARGLSNLGSALRQLGEPEAARETLEHALSLDPNCASAHHNLGHLFKTQDKLDQALMCFERALALDQDPNYYCSLGVMLLDKGELQRARGLLERAIELKPDFALAYRNLGIVLDGLGKPDEAVACYNKALLLHPDSRDARYCLGATQLLQGDFRAGWANVEFRWGCFAQDTKPRLYPQPKWTGEAMESGQVYLWGEQGIGDEIMFAGLIPDALKTGNRLLLECDSRLQPLFSRSFPEIQVIRIEDEPHYMESNAKKIAAHLPTGSLPLLFRSAWDSFAATKSPYLKADACKTESFRSQYAGRRRCIGLAWLTMAKKTGRRRSIELSRLRPLFDVPGIQWVSLQYGNFDALEQQVGDVHAPLLIDRAVDQLKDMDLFAAQVAAMDMVISIDNATVHLAGALGIPTWVMLPFAPDWRWMLEREDSPWYPTLRLFRQGEDCAWEPVIERVRAELSAEMGR